MVATLSRLAKFAIATLPSWGDQIRRIASIYRKESPNIDIDDESILKNDLKDIFEASNLQASVRAVIKEYKRQYDIYRRRAKNKICLDLLVVMRDRECLRRRIWNSRTSKDPVEIRIIDGFLVGFCETLSGGLEAVVQIGEDEFLLLKPRRNRISSYEVETKLQSWPYNSLPRRLFLTDNIY